jgi:hypothetical protein
MDEIFRLSKDVNHLIKVHNGIRGYIRQFDFLLFTRRFNIFFMVREKIVNTGQ